MSQLFIIVKDVDSIRPGSLAQCREINHQITYFPKFGSRWRRFGVFFIVVFFQLLSYLNDARIMVNIGISL